MGFKLRSSLFYRFSSLFCLEGPALFDEIDQVGVNNAVSLLQKSVGREQIFRIIIVLYAFKRSVLSVLGLTALEDWFPDDWTKKTPTVEHFFSLNSRITLFSLGFRLFSDIVLLPKYKLR